AIMPKNKGKVRFSRRPWGNSTPPPPFRRSFFFPAGFRHFPTSRPRRREQRSEETRNKRVRNMMLTRCTGWQEQAQGKERGRQHQARARLQGGRPGVCAGPEDAG